MLQFSIGCGGDNKPSLITEGGGMTIEEFEKMQADIQKKDIERRIEEGQQGAEEELEEWEKQQEEKAAGTGSEQ
ncbi:hypothetical protein RSSM_02915 [Rhodopirellula sallentina SM41]|uniref:Uncharacterized protein n=2 Tax=Rhodopirellula TaxID=265488 RepID=M5U2G6_9BACT|nr:hypothetical protein RSSM_02915 [Rhodopirellula sallentina SM41]